MTRSAGILFSLIIALAFSNCQSSSGQVLEKFIGPKRANTEFVPESAFAGAAIFPLRLAEDPKFDLFPREIVTAWGKKELGFDPMLIKQATFIVKKMDGLNRPPQWAGVLHFEKMQGLAGGVIDKLEKKKVGGKAMFSGTSLGLPSFLVYDEATMFVGDEALFEEMVESKRRGKLVDLMKGASVKGELVAFADLESVRPVLNQAMLALPGGLPPVIAKLKQIPNMIDAIEIGVTVDGRVKTEVVIHATDSEGAAEANKIIKNALDFGLEMGIGVMASQMDFNDPVQEALVTYAQRAGEDYKSRFQPKLNGNKMSLSLDQEATMLPVLIGMLLPAVQQTRAAARRAQSMNNARQMILAGHNYASAYGHFPTQASYDKNGKPLLSWRVHILPFIDQNELYKQFRLDEPWDSPHNSKLLSKMPQIYQSPSVAVEDGKTVYLGAAGEGMMFNGKEKIGFGQITDGSSNTVYMMEVNQSHAVEWTRPVDYQVNPEKPLDGLGGVNAGGFIVTMADGSAQFISNSIDPEMWLKLLTKGGGEITSGDW